MRMIYLKLNYCSVKTPFFLISTTVFRSRFRSEALNLAKLYIFGKLKRFLIALEGFWGSNLGHMISKDPKPDVDLNFQRYYVTFHAQIFNI